MTRLQQLHDGYGQSPWLDNLTRDYLRDGTLARMVSEGIRGVTANPTIFAKAIEGSNAYDAQFADLLRAGRELIDAYWDVVVDDVVDALGVLRPVYDASGGGDGFVSIEVAPGLAYDTDQTVAEAQELYALVDRENVLIKIPATLEGLPAIAATIGKGISVNVTLIFSEDRYRGVMDAYLTGLETADAAGIDLSKIHSVASFFISRVDSEIDKRLNNIGTDAALALKGKAAIANAQVALAAYEEVFGGERFAKLAAKGANRQRPLWASTGTKDPSYPDTLYVSDLVATAVVNTMPEKTMMAFADHGVVGTPMEGTGPDGVQVLDALDAVGIDLDDVFAVLEAEGVSKFIVSWDSELVTSVEKALAAAT